MDTARFFICLFGFYGMGLLNGATNGTGSNQKVAIVLGGIFVLMALLFSFFIVFGEKRK
jgi:hypothetical protein